MRHSLHLAGEIETALCSYEGVLHWPVPQKLAASARNIFQEKMALQEQNLAGFGSDVRWQLINSEREPLNSTKLMVSGLNPYTR